MKEWWKSQTVWSQIVRMVILFLGTSVGLEVSEADEATIVAIVTGLVLVATEAWTFYGRKRAQGPLKLKKPKQN
jgi:uncharacterized membrane protein YfcA